MNLFILDYDPAKAAKFQANKHIVKMPSEVANMLMLPFKRQGFKLPNSKGGSEVKLSHENHPCSVWVRQSPQNFVWALTHLQYLIYEYEERYGKHHYAATYAVFASENARHLSFPREGLTPFARCFSSYKELIDANPKLSDTVSAYREFYRHDKQSFARWPSISDIPLWWNDSSEGYVDKNFLNGRHKSLTAE